MKQLFRTKDVARSTRRNAAHGFSLIEILVVMVVLLIGILSILRLFPPGFLTIQRTGEITNADALISQMSESLRNQLSVPEAIVPAQIETDGNGNIKPLFQPDIRPDDYTEFRPGEYAPESGLTFLPEDDYFKSNVNRIRYIQGETFRIPVSAQAGGGPAGSIYMLQNGPAFNPFHDDATNNNAPADGLVVYGAALTRSVQSSVDANRNGDSTAATLTDTTEYAIDYDNLKIAFFPQVGTSSRDFFISFDYYDTGSQTVKTLPKTKVTIPDQDATKIPAGETPQPQWVSLKSFSTLAAVLTSNTKILADTDNVYRAFRLISKLTYLNTDGSVNTTAQAAIKFSNDPYEYAWYSPQFGPASAPGNPGVLMFNPKGRVTIIDTNASDTGAVGFNNQQPITARIDYFTYDNHVIRDERIVPAQAPYSVKLSLPFTTTNGDVNNDLEPFTGLFRDGVNNPPNQVVTPDILVYDPIRGSQVSAYSADTKTMPAINQGIKIVLSARTGTITFVPNSDSSADKTAFETAMAAYKGQTLRVFYRAQRDWGMQLQKACAHYTLTQSQDEFLSPGGYNKYYIDPAQNTNQPTRVYFRACEAGKVVVLGDVHFAVPDNTGMLPTTPDKIQAASGESYRIDDNAINFRAFTDGNGVTHNCPYIDITTQHPNAVLSTLATGRYVGNVQGVSFKSRVIWRNSGRLDDNANDISRWRRVENESILSPSGRY